MNPRDLLKNTWQAEPPAPPSLQVADLPWWRRRFRLRLQTNQTFFNKFLALNPVLALEFAEGHLAPANGFDAVLNGFFLTRRQGLVGIEKRFQIPLRRMHIAFR